MQQREPKEVVAAAMLFLLKQRVPRQKLKNVLADWGSYTPAKLGKALFIKGELGMNASDLVKRAFRDMTPVYDERLMAEWLAWLTALADWDTAKSNVHELPPHVPGMYELGN